MSSLGELRTLARQRGQGRTRKSEKAAYLFMLPWMVGLLTITVLPMLASLVMSFSNYRIDIRYDWEKRKPRWVGWDNYTQMFADQNWRDSVWVTVKYVVFGVPLQLAAALGLALLLDRGLRGLPFYRSVLYLPSLLGGSVAVAILWRVVFDSNGIFNDFLGLFGLDRGWSWVGQPSTALWTIILLHVWTFGSPMVIFLAGLRQIPRMYYEAAQVDGASRWRQFRSVTLPLLSPIIFFNLVLQTIGAFQAFTQAFVVSDGKGGPLNSTLFYSVYLYDTAFSQSRMGAASAMAWVLLVAIAAVTALFFATSRFWVFYED